MLSQRILFVDDDADWRLIVKDCLEDAGFEVIIAKDATQAMVETGGFKLDLIILDLDLGGENGFVLLKFLELNYPDVPFVLYTGLLQAEVAAQTMTREGDQPYLRKGTMQELLEGVRDALSQQQTTPNHILQSEPA